MQNLGLPGSELAKDFSQARRLDTPAEKRVKTLATSRNSLYSLPVAKDLASTDERKALLFVDGFENLVNLSFSDALRKTHAEIKSTSGISTLEYNEKARRIRKRP